jgi:hypothetical protein
MEGLNTHAWIRQISLAYMPGELTPALEQVLSPLLDWLRSYGCTVQSKPTNETDLIITTTRFGVPIDNKEAILFNGKRRYRLRHRPHVLTAIDIPETEYQYWLEHFSELREQPAKQQKSHKYPALGPRAVEVLLDQARRGGPMLALGRFLQAYVKSFRVMAVRSEASLRPLCAVHFDLAGARPVTDAADLPAFAQEVGLRVLAATCTAEINNHIFLPEPLPAQTWERLSTPEAMIRAGTMFAEFDFFTNPVSIEKLIGYRELSEAVSAHYSEGCYAVFEPEIPGLIATATGSARLVDKRHISRTDQAIVIGVKPEGDGAIVRSVADRGQVVPSVEAVEMMKICQAASTHEHINGSGRAVDVPNVRAILHGHLGVASYNPDKVESVSLDPPYYSHLVSCGTGALAAGTATAFGRSSSLGDLNDPRAVIFLEQPGHGVVVVEKWVKGRRPFEVIREYLAKRDLEMTLDVPQGSILWERQQLPNGHPVMQKAV